MHNVLVGSYNKLKDENAELQKQVDELKKENARLDKNIKWYQEKIEDGELVSKQAVKDMARELLQEVANEYSENVGYTDWLDDCYWGDVQIRLCKKYGLKVIQTKKGVEVE